jgi:hypothetical protein
MEISWKCRPRQANDNLVANLKIASPTDNATYISATIGSRAALRRYANLTPTNGLAIRLSLRRELKNLTDNDWPSNFKLVAALFFETHLNQLGHDRIWGCIARKINIFGKPRQWNAH